MTGLGGHGSEVSFFEALELCLISPTSRQDGKEHQLLGQKFL
jgi:hypothetical protein